MGESRALEFLGAPHGLVYLEGHLGEGLSALSSGPPKAHLALGSGWPTQGPAVMLAAAQLVTRCRLGCTVWS